MRAAYSGVVPLFAHIPCCMHALCLLSARASRLLYVCSLLVHISPAGSWHHLDLSYNSLGPGSSMMLCEVIRRLGLSAASYIMPRKYAQHWVGRTDSVTPSDPHASAKPTSTRSPSPSQLHHSSHGDGDEGGEGGGTRSHGRASYAAPAAVHVRGTGSDSGGSVPPLGSHGKPKAPKAHTMLGSQLAVAPVEIVIDGNPLGLSGMR